MAMRLSGLMSGMDTESIVSQLVEARKTKVTKAVKAQKSLKYKQDAWKTLNTQIVSLYSKTLSNLRFESSFTKKKTKVSNSSTVSVITGEGAMNSVQSLKVNELAQSGYLTGGKLKTVDGDAVTGKTKLGDLGFTGKTNLTVMIGDDVDTRTPITVNGDTTVSKFISDLRNAGVNANFDEDNGRIFIASKSSGKENDFSLLANDVEGAEALMALKLDYAGSMSQTLRDSAIGNQIQSTMSQRTAERNDLLERMKNIVNDSNNTKIKDALAEMGYNDVEALDYSKLRANPDVWEIFNKDLKQAFGDDAEGKKQWDSIVNTLNAVEADLKIDSAGNVTGLAEKVEAGIKKDNDVQKAAGKDAEISLNGVIYSSSSNNFHVNGLTLAVNATTAEGESITLTTEDDTDGIYDMIKNFFKEYNSLINQMDKLYNADSAKGYEPLTDEEKEAMSDSQIDEWEKKIQESILRKDTTLGSLATAMKTVMMQGVDMKTGEVDINGNPVTKKMYLSNFGINTLGYFIAPENEKNAYHIDGDSDDADTSGNADKLKSMIANDPNTVIEFFTGLANNLYNEMFKTMDRASEYSSFHTAYDDKKMQIEYDDYTKKIKDLEDKLADYEDKWYAKFAAMETALAKMQNNASAVTALLGG